MFAKYISGFSPRFVVVVDQGPSNHVNMLKIRIQSMLKRKLFGLS